MIRWAAIQRVVETRDFFLFFFNARQAHYLPKRAIPTAEDLQHVRELVGAHVGARFERLAVGGAA